MSIGLAQASATFGNNVFNGAPRNNDGSNHANDRHYSTLRDHAREAQSKHMHFAAEASKAYKTGDKAQASAYSAKSKQYQAEADRLNDEAASWVFLANNTDSAKDEIDLHGLYVKEAIVALDARIKVCQQNGQPLLKAIVGQGIHSQSHIAKLRPAVMSHCNELHLPNSVHRHNAGVVLIHLSGAPQIPLSYTQPQGYGAQGYAPQQQPMYQQDAGAPSNDLCSLFCRVLQQCLK